MSEIRDVIIIGGGPAGYTAALYAARANLRPLVFEGFAYGGQLMITSDVENYPRFEEGIMGPELMATMRKQAERFGAELVADDVTRVDFSGHPLKVYLGDEEHWARSVIVATGATARQIGLPSERQLQGMGVSYCAVCDASFFRDKHVIVVGGGDSAMEEASFLAKFATDVKLVHRRDAFRASKIMIDYARSKDNVEFITNATVDEVLGADEGRVTGVRLRDTLTGEHRDMPADACSWRSATTPRPGCSRASWTWTRQATCSPRMGPRRPTSRACSPPATSSTTSTARPSPRPGWAAWRRLTPSAGWRTSSRRRRRPRPARSPESGCNPGQYPSSMPRYWICPNCGTRAIDDDGRDGLSHQQVGCAKCGFGFLFELLEDFYPPASAGFVACDKDTRVISCGKGVFELTGFGESDLLGKPLVEAFGLSGFAENANPVAIVMEWGVRKLDQPLVLRHRSGRAKPVRVDLFPAYDDDGGLLASLAPRQE
jgi:thioredoxin reductase (NADPH)